jgi:predicted SAM-dependent methyltransferase
MIKAYTTGGFRKSVRTLLAELRLQQRHRAGVKRARATPLPADARIQFGSGSKARPGWINIDLFAPDADFALDLREKLPFPDNVASLIHSQHVLEHFGYPSEVHRLLAESLRILRPGGVFSVGVPDCGEALLAYARNDDEFFTYWRLRSYLATEKPTRMHHVNYLFRQDGRHQYGWDEETLGQVLTNAGFVNARRREFDPEMDSENRRQRTLYMEAEKPHAAR